MVKFKIVESKYCIFKRLYQQAQKMGYYITYNMLILFKHTNIYSRWIIIAHNVKGAGIFAIKEILTALGCSTSNIFRILPHNLF